MSSNKMNFRKMNFRKKGIIAVTAAIISGACLVSGQALASHHFETTFVQKNPTLNQSDNYVFASERPDHTVFVMDVSVTPEAGEGGIFSTDALYNIHVSSDETFETGHTFTLDFNEDNQFTVYQSDTPNGDVGAVGDEIGEGTIGEASELSDGIKVWAGAIQDPFYGNSPSLGLLRAQLNAGQPYNSDIWAQAEGTSIFVGRKAGSIVLDVPNSMLGSTLRVFMTTAIQQDDTWQQVQYSANPLFSHIMLFENEALKVSHDRSRPNMQNAIKPIVAARISRAATLADSQEDPIKYGNDVADTLVPDVLTYEAGTPAIYSAAERNGRPLDDDAMSEVLTMLLGTPTDQKIENPKLYTESFPYVIPVSVE